MPIQFNIYALMFAASLFLAGASAFPMKLEDTQELFASPEAKMLAVSVKLFVIGLILFAIGYMRGGRSVLLLQIPRFERMNMLRFILIVVIGVNGFTNLSLMILPDGLAMTLLFGCIFSVCLAYNYKYAETWVALLFSVLAVWLVLHGSLDMVDLPVMMALFGVAAAVVAGTSQGYFLNAKMVPPAITDMGMMFGLCFIAGSILWLASCLIVFGDDLLGPLNTVFLMMVLLSAFMNVFCWLMIVYYRDQMTAIERTTCTGFEAVGGVAIQSALLRFDIAVLIGVVFLFLALVSKKIVVFFRKGLDSVKGE